MARVRDPSDINRQRPEFWQLAVHDLSDHELIVLTCGLCYVESELNWAGGSVAGVVWLYRILVARRVNRPDLDTEFRWIRDRSKNPYNPLGTRITLGARSYGKCLAASDSRQVAKRTWVEEDREREQQAVNERQLRRDMAAACARARNTDARQREVLAIEGLALPVKLAYIAHYPDFFTSIFPAAIANAAGDEIVGRLPRDVQLALARKLKGKDKGPWSRFRSRLLRVLGPIWDKRSI